MLHTTKFILLIESTHNNKLFVVYSEFRKIAKKEHAYQY